MFRRACLALAVALLPACSLLVKSDDLVGGTAPAAADGGKPGDGVDAGTEAGADGSSSTDGASGCPAGAVCDDFEGAGTIAWRPMMTGNATIGVDAVKPKSGMRSLHASRPIAAGRELAYYELTP